MSLICCSRFLKHAKGSSLEPLLNIVLGRKENGEKEKWSRRKAKESDENSFPSWCLVQRWKIEGKRGVQGTMWIKQSDFTWISGFLPLSEGLDYEGMHRCNPRLFSFHLPIPFLPNEASNGETRKPLSLHPPFLLSF